MKASRAQGFLSEIGRVTSAITCHLWWQVPIGDYVMTATTSLPKLIIIIIIIISLPFILLIKMKLEWNNEEKLRRATDYINDLNDDKDVNISEVTLNFRVHRSLLSSRIHH